MAGRVRQEVCDSHGPYEVSGKKADWGGFLGLDPSVLRGNPSRLWKEHLTQRSRSPGTLDLTTAAGFSRLNNAEAGWALTPEHGSPFCDSDPKDI